MSRKETIAGIVRAILLVLLGMLTFVLGSRLYARWHGGGSRPAACAGCPLAGRCETSKGRIVHE